MSLAFLKSPAPESSGPIPDTQKPSRPYESLPSQEKLLTFSSRADPPAELISCTFRQPRPQQPLAQAGSKLKLPSPAPLWQWPLGALPSPTVDRRQGSLRACVFL